MNTSVVSNLQKWYTSPTFQANVRKYKRKWESGRQWDSVWSSGHGLSRLIEFLHTSPLSLTLSLVLNSMSQFSSIMLSSLVSLVTDFIALHKYDLLQPRRLWTSWSPWQRAPHSWEQTRGQAAGQERHSRGAQCPNHPANTFNYFQAGNTFPTSG